MHVLKNKSFTPPTSVQRTWCVFVFCLPVGIPSMGLFDGSSHLQVKTTLLSTYS